jgi:flagellin
LGATVNRLESRIKSLAVGRENIAAAENRIRDTDMAAEMTEVSRRQILFQSGTSMLSQANSNPQSVMSLFR